jgi:hypothetical protein
LKPTQSTLSSFTVAVAVIAAFFLGRAIAPQKTGLAAPPSLSGALAEQDPIARSFRLSAFLGGLDSDDLPEVVETLDAKEVVGVSEEELELIMLAWTALDAPGAFEWASRQKRPGWRTMAPTAAMYAWGYRDPAAARAALEQLGLPRSRRELQSAFVSGWILSGDEQGVTDYLVSLPPSDERQVWTNWLVNELRQDGAEAVIAWADAIPEDAPASFKAVAFRIAANAVAGADPDRVVSWYEANQGGDYTAGALRFIARRWVEFHDPAALFEWLITLPPSPDRAIAVRAGFSSWHGRSRDEAEAWLLEAPRVAALDPAPEHLATTRMAISLNASAEWALRIRDDERRRLQLTRIGTRWSRRDPEGMQAWIAAVEISREDREALLEPGRARAARRAKLSEEDRESAARRPRGRAALLMKRRAERAAAASEPDPPLTE